MPDWELGELVWIGDLDWAEAETCALHWAEAAAAQTGPGTGEHRDSSAWTALLELALVASLSAFFFSFFWLAAATSFFQRLAMAKHRGRHSEKA